MAITRSQKKAIFTIGKPIKEEEENNENYEDNEESDEDTTEEEIIFKYWEGYPYWAITANVIKNNIDNINWDELSSHCIDIDILDKYKDKINWIYQSKTRNLSIEKLVKFADCLDWDSISSHYQHLSEDVILHFNKLVKFDLITEWQFKNLSNEFIVKYLPYLHLDILSHQQRLSKKHFITFAHKYVDGCTAKYFEPLPEEFFIDFRDYISPINNTKFDWKVICQYQKLSIDAIEELYNFEKGGGNTYIFWDVISEYQNLDQAFYEKHKNKLNILKIKEHQKNIKIGDNTYNKIYNLITYLISFIY